MTDERAGKTITKKAGLLDLYSLSRVCADPPLYANVAISVLLESNDHGAPSWHDCVARTLPALVRQYPQLLSTIVGFISTTPEWVYIDEKVPVEQVLVDGDSLADFSPESIDAVHSKEVNSCMAPTIEPKCLWKIILSPCAASPDKCLLTFSWCHCIVDGMGATYILKAIVKFLNEQTSIGEDAPPPPATLELSELQLQSEFPASFEERVDTKANIWSALPHLLPSFRKRTHWQGTIRADPAAVPQIILKSKVFPLSKLQDLCKLHKTTVHSAIQQLVVRTIATLTGPDCKLLADSAINIRSVCGEAGHPVDVTTELGNYTAKYSKTYSSTDLMKRDFWADAREYRIELVNSMPNGCMGVGLLRYLDYPNGYKKYWNGPHTSCSLGRAATVNTSNLGRLTFDASDAAGKNSVNVTHCQFGQSTTTTSVALTFNVISVGDSMTCTLSTHLGCVEQGFIDSFWPAWQSQWDTFVV
ncbi:hypothetical protein DFJ77DRAFT_266344 [Powellomyces hirtus]|nr:hypothetical protein DFJ77DRAFT_266344 [Powellomyces hirtus]